MKMISSKWWLSGIASKIQSHPKFRNLVYKRRTVDLALTKSNVRCVLSGTLTHLWCSISTIVILIPQSASATFVGRPCIIINSGATKAEPTTSSPSAQCARKSYTRAPSRGIWWYTTQQERANIKWSNANYVGRP